MPRSDLFLRWSAKDLKLAIAEMQLRDDLGSCGHPHSISTQPGAIDRYKVETDRVCGACARLEEHRKSHPELPPGTLERVVDVTAPRPGAAPEEPDAFGPVFD